MGQLASVLPEERNFLWTLNASQTCQRYGDERLLSFFCLWRPSAGSVPLLDQCYLLVGRQGLERPRYPRSAGLFQWQSPRKVLYHAHN